MGADNPNETQELVEEYENLVYKLAHKIHRRVAARVELEDLISWGYMGLMEAHQRYDSQSGAQFATFAYYRIRGAMLDALSKIRSDQETRSAAAYNEIFETYAHTVSAQGNQATIEGRLSSLSSLSANLAMVCILGESPETALRPQGAPHQRALIRLQTQEKVRSALERLPQTERELLKGYYFEERSLSEMAAEKGYSPSWASRIHNRALERLRGMIESDESLDDLRYALPI